MRHLIWHPSGRSIIFFSIVFCALGSPVTPALTAQEAAPQALSLTQVIDMLTSGVSPDRVLTIAKSDCVAFIIDQDAAQRLRRAGAADVFLSSLRQVCNRAVVSIGTPVNTAATSQLSPEEYYKRGAAVFESRQYAEAEAIFRDGIGYYPSNSTLLANMGSALNNQARFAEAEPYLRRAIQESPNWKFPRALLVRSLSDQGRSADAAVAQRGMDDVDKRAAADAQAKVDAKRTSKRSGKQSTVWALLFVGVAVALVFIFVPAE